jgi:hypothetical protein
MPSTETTHNHIGWESPVFQEVLTNRRLEEAALPPLAYGEQTLKTLGWEREHDPSFDDVAFLDSEREKLCVHLGQLDEAEPRLRDQAATTVANELSLVGFETPDPRPATLQAIVNGMDAATLEAFLVRHVQGETQREHAFQEQVEYYKVRFMEAVETAIAAGRLPASINTQTVGDRLQKLVFHGIDPLFGIEGATYDPEIHAVGLPRASGSWANDEIIEPDGRSASLIHVTTHEVFHGINGKHVAVHEGELAVTRSGLHAAPNVSGAEHDTDGTWSYGWLEEAATERATMALFDLSKPATRREEISLMDSLLTKGTQEIPQATIMEPYFEDSAPNSPTSAWRRFEDAVDAAYSPLFLKELDSMATADQGFNTNMALEYMTHLEDPRSAAAELRQMREAAAHEAGLPPTASWSDIKSAS